MKHHWEYGLNIKKMILDAQPKHVLEIGALEGENTENLKSLMKELGYKLTVISDDLEIKDDGVNRIRGISYLEIPKLEDKSIDFVLLDTDHNYWTMERELESLYPKLVHGATVIIHDTEAYYYNTGMAIASEVGDSYGDGSDYPLNEIRKRSNECGGMSLAIIDTLSRNRICYKLQTWLSDGVGIAVIKKNPQQFQVVTIVPASIGKGNRKGSRDELIKV